MKEIDNRVYLEDALLTWKVLRVIYLCHDLKVERVLRHVRVFRYEVDAVAEAYTFEKNIMRLIGFELKDSDFYKAFYQAKERRKYFDYFYVVIDLSARTIVEYLLDLGRKKLDGIGFISAKEEVIVLPSKFKKREKATIASKRQVDKSQVDLLEFIRKDSWREITNA